MHICTKTRGEVLIIRQMLEAIQMKVLRKIVSKRKIDGIRESCSIQPIEWMERQRREWDEQETRMDAERLVKISRDNIWYLPEDIAYNNKEEEESEEEEEEEEEKCFD